MLQLFSEQKVADYLASTSSSYDTVIASSSDFLFMNHFEVGLLQNVTENAVITSVQQNGHNGYTNGFYIGKPRSVINVMSRLRSMANITKDTVAMRRE